LAPLTTIHQGELLLFAYFHLIESKKNMRKVLLTFIVCSAFAVVCAQNNYDHRKAFDPTFTRTRLMLTEVRVASLGRATGKTVQIIKSTAL
jgi:hypothetical protein